jgi:hypothetical protein
MKKKRYLNDKENSSFHLSNQNKIETPSLTDQLISHLINKKIFHKSKSSTPKSSWDKSNFFLY